MQASMNDHAFVARLSAMEGEYLDSRSGSAVPLNTVKNDSMGAVVNAFQHTLGIEFIDSDIQAIRSLLSGSAVEVLVKDKVLDRRPHCLLATGCLLGLGGISVHMLFVDDQTAESRISLLQPAAERLGLSTSCITAVSSSAARVAAYAADIVFLSARERALDYLRDNLGTTEDIGNIGDKLRFLQRLGQQKVGQQFHQHSNATTFGLFEDIDLTLCEGAMTPVHLYGNTLNATRNASADDTIIAASNFFRVFSTYGRLGGLGEQLDDSTADSFDHYSIAQSHIDGVVESPRGIMAVQRDNVRNQLQVYPAIRPAGLCLAESVKSLISQGAAVIVERVPTDDIQSVQEVLQQHGVNAAVGDVDSIYQLARQNTQSICLLLPFSLSRIPGMAAEGSLAISQSVNILSLSIEESFRAEKRKRSRMQDLFFEPQFFTLLADNYEELGVPGAVKTLLNLMPKILRDAIVGALIHHKQKEADRHRSRTIKALIKYEKELDDLLAFSG